MPFLPIFKIEVNVSPDVFCVNLIFPADVIVHAPPVVLPVIVIVPSFKSSTVVR